MGEGGRAGGFDGDTTVDGFPRKDGDSLFGKMMLAIRGSHSFGNKVRMLKFPLILTDTKLYGGALANFYWLTRALELRLESPEVQAHPIITHVRDLGLKVTEGYEADLKQLLGEDWQTAAARARTPATDSYVAAIQNADAVQLVAAAFILYGALVIGGGKQTQIKVRSVFPDCNHLVFDIAEDMPAARSAFRRCFNEIGKKFPEHYDALISEAAIFMGRNNEVVLNIRCLPFWWWRAVGVAASIGLALFWARRTKP